MKLYSLFFSCYSRSRLMWVRSKVITITVNVTLKCDHIKWLMALTSDCIKRLSLYHLITFRGSLNRSHTKQRNVILLHLFQVDLSLLDLSAFISATRGSIILNLAFHLDIKSPWWNFTTSYSVQNVNSPEKDPV